MEKRGKGRDMGDGERVWAHLVCKQAVPAMGEGFRTGVVGCQKGCGWVFDGPW